MEHDECDLGDDRLCLVCLASRDDLGPVSIRRIISGARGAGLSLCEALRLPQSELSARLGLAPTLAAAVAAIRSPRLQGQAILKDLESTGGRAVFEGDEHYSPSLPACLGRAAPPVLFVAGEPAILSSPCVAVVGSRTPSREALAAARAFAASLAAAGDTVVSGGAQGIDAAGHQGAITAGATAVVPPRGILRFKWRELGLDESWDGRWCVVGQFPPRDGWRTKYALIRNRTIVALCRAVVAFEPRERGGTQHSCAAALDMRKPLFVASAATDGARRRGLERLVRAGAVALDPRDMPTAEDFERLVRDCQPPPGAAQLPLLEAGNAAEWGRAASAGDQFPTTDDG
ncbi:MAG: DNA-processing protein DprA [Candidatus Brocadiia bacterium]|nr:DNA-processing protein DprA [Candidatus Brocadiia bacterium]